MEYIACGKNILLTDMVAHINVVGRKNSYFWIHDTTPESFAKSIEEVYGCYKNDPHVFYEKGMMDREEFVDKITWECRSLSLQEYLSRITESV